MKVHRHAVASLTALVLAGSGCALATPAQAAPVTAADASVNALEGTLNVRITAGSAALGRKWRLIVITLPKCHALLAPAGCLQYHGANDGALISLNL
ncbi:hypothetical protein [Streptomyces sp. NPDC058989]|uniref:hypothetical protein n=1 Tax=Streptomyces sp. NPDC058989 TaxID=3346686 RepID=UPI0036AB7350